MREQSGFDRAGLSRILSRRKCMPTDHQKAGRMPSFEEAVRLILEAVSPSNIEAVPLLDSLGRVSATEVSAPWSTPRYDNSAMDGFAVRAADCITGAALPIR